MSGAEVTAQEFFSLFGESILASVVAATLCGYLGFFVVTRRVAFVSASLGQISGLGIAFGFFVGQLLGHNPHGDTPAYLDPVVHALVFSGVAAVVLGLLPSSDRITTESVVALTYLAAAALTLIVLSSPMIVQEAHEVGDLLFGNVVAVRHDHLVELEMVAAVVLLSHLVLFRDLLFVSFDREMALAVGLPVRRLELFLHLSIGASVAVTTRAVGALPVFGFLVLPAGAALLLASSVRWVIALSVMGAVGASAVGFYVSFRGVSIGGLAFDSLPTGPTMVAFSAIYWPAAVLVRLVARRWRVSKKSHDV